MYFRTTRRKNRDGSTVEYYQLAHNVWDPDKGRSTVQIAHNFGRADSLDRDALVRLCRSIAKACELEVLDSLAEGKGEASSDLWPDDLEQCDTFELGPILVIEHLWKKLGLDRLLSDLAQREGMTVPYERALFALVANRLCSPESKLGVWDRWLPTVYLPSCWELKLAQFYEAMDLLHEHSADVEEKVFFSTANLFNLEVDLVFYDTTTAEFTVDEADTEGELALRRWGESKDGGSKVQVVVALAVTRDGLPVRSWVFPGNTNDMATIERVRADLRAWQLGRCLLIGDCGLNSAQNRAELARACGRYLLAVRPDGKEIRQHVLTRRGRYRRVAENLRVKEVLVGEGERRRRYFVCYNPKQARRQAVRREQVLNQIEAEFDRHTSRNCRARWVVELRSSRRTGRYLSIDEDGDVFIDLDKVERAEKLDGKWVLMTNDDSITAEDAATGYKALGVIERCFRSLKSAQVEIKPIYHWLSRRIEAHVKICVLALLLQRIAERECGSSWPRLREDLARLKASQFQSPQHVFFRRNRMPKEVGAILKRLKIQPPKRILTIV